MDSSMNSSSLHDYSHFVYIFIYFHTHTLMLYFHIFSYPLTYGHALVDRVLIVSKILLTVNDGGI